MTLLYQNVAPVPLVWGNIRQVMVTGIKGMNGLPCVPRFESEKKLTFIPNGTFVTFMNSIPPSSEGDSEMWLFQLTDDPGTSVLINPSAWEAGYLWKAVRKVPTKGRAWRNGR